MAAANKTQSSASPKTIFFDNSHSDRKMSQHHPHYVRPTTTSDTHRHCTLTSPSSKKLMFAQRTHTVLPELGLSSEHLYNERTESVPIRQTKYIFSVCGVCGRRTTSATQMRHSCGCFRPCVIPAFAMKTRMDSCENSSIILTAQSAITV